MKPVIGNHIGVQTILEIVSKTLEHNLSNIFDKYFSCLDQNKIHLYTLLREYC